MPDSSDFLRFATDHAPGLVRLASAVTGDDTRAERLVEDALVEAFRAWPQAPPLDPLVDVRRAVVAAGSPRRLRLRRASRGLQLQDVMVSPSPAADASDAEGRLWEAVQDLPTRHQRFLVLRFAAGLSLADAARVLKLPVVVADRLQRRALSQLRLAADLDVPARRDEDARTKAGAFEMKVCHAIRAHVSRPDVDVARLVDRVRERTSGTPPGSNRSPVLSGAMAVTVTATVAATVAFLIVWGRGDYSARPAAVPPAPPGTQLVGYRRIAVAVPATWVLHESPCGRTVAPGRVSRSATDRTCGGAPLTTSVTLTDAPVNFPAEHAPPVRTGRVAGQISMQTAVVHFDGMYQQAVFVFGARFMLIVRSRDRSMVSAIVRSMRAVPDGYAVVPTCRSLPIREAVRALAAVGLTASIAHTSSIPMWHGEPPVLFQNKPPGSIVRDGTIVALTIPGR